MTRGTRLAALTGIAVLVPALGLAGLAFGETLRFAPAEVLRGLGACAGLGDALPGSSQAILELRLWRVLVAFLVGASLALAGGLLQGLFRNPLASPALLGTTSGAGLGALVAVLAAGGYGPELVLRGAAHWPLLLVPAGAFAGALLATFVVLGAGLLLPGTGLARLLLVGLALNTGLAGLSALLQSLWLEDWEVSRAIVAWGFGTLEGRAPEHAAMVAATLLLAIPVLPFLHRELDLLALGEGDAQALGVRPRRVRVQVVVLSSLLTGGAVAVAGQIGFVGLILPNLVRLLVGPAHRWLLPASALSGGAFLLGVDLTARTLLARYALPPGVLLAVLGAPVFFVLLCRRREAAPL